MYTEAELVRIAKRENNTRRKYLVVNRLQGKHIPVSPKEALQMFRSLAELIKEAYPSERLLMVGFAETATAIGAAVAIECQAAYMQTTREVIDGVDYLYFSESHSHATEQKLVKTDLDKIIGKTDRIVFIEDEVTTGNTILNIVRLIQKTYAQPVSFAVASILNGMNEEALENYKNLKIPVHYLVKTAHDTYTEIAEQYQADGTCHICTKPQEKEATDRSAGDFGLDKCKKTPYGRYLQTGVRAALAGNTAKIRLHKIHKRDRNRQTDTGPWHGRIHVSGIICRGKIRRNRLYSADACHNQKSDRSQ